MPNVQHCLAMADEAERLAAVVSYGRDKARLKRQAESWREQALANKARALLEADSPKAKASSRGVMSWFRRTSA